MKTPEDAPVDSAAGKAEAKKAQAVDKEDDEESEEVDNWEDEDIESEVEEIW